jgi:hypothetical protein
MKKIIKKPQSNTSKKDLIDNSFSTVISMIENGYNISEALNKLGIAKPTFYRHITKEQKCLLDIAKTANTKYGAGRAYP